MTALYCHVQRSDGLEEGTVSKLLVLVSKLLCSHSPIIFQEQVFPGAGT